MKLFEQIFNEANKARLLAPLYDLYNTDDTISFNDLNTFVNRFDNTFDWNSPDKEKLFKEIISKYKAYIENGGSRKERKAATKKDVKKLFKDVFGDKCVSKYDPESENGSDIDVIILDEIENEDWIFVVPLNHKAAEFMDSFACGGAGAQWCIGTKNDDSKWDEYVVDKQDIFVLALRKNAYEHMDRDDIKYMLEFEPEALTDDVCWDQQDHRNYLMSEWKEKFGRSYDEISVELGQQNVIQYFIDVYNQDTFEDFED